MEQQSTTSHIAGGEAAQPETIEPQQQTHEQIKSSDEKEKDEQLAFLKPELLCVSFIGLFHNLGIFVFVLFYLFYWSYGLHYVIKETNDLKNKTNSTSLKVKIRFNELQYATIGNMMGFVLVHVIGTVLAIGAIIMDVILRGTTNPVNQFQFYLNHFN